MVRKRKIRIADEEKENEDESTAAASSIVSGGESLLHGPMYTIMSNVQLNEIFHKRYVKEMKQLYAKMDHDAFFFTFIKMVKSAMEAEESNEYAHTTLLFCSKFVTSYDIEETHPLMNETVNWLMTTISNNPHIRFRLCQFVNMLLNALGQEAALDDSICDRILEYMLGRLRDVSPNVRVQAILAMQRLQMPDNPDDPVLRAYQFHLCADPSPRVRQAVITCMGRNHQTIPYILERLWDIDEKVRRHTYLHMSSYPVRTYKVAQRVMLLEQGINDRSELVRKVVVTIMLKQWIDSYQNNLIALVTALKLDSKEEEIVRFRKITKQALTEVFRTQNKEDLLSCLPLEEDGEFHRCVPHDQLTIEITLYWQCLTQYLQAEMAEEMDLIVPELSTFCAYIEKFCTAQRPDMDQFDAMEFQYMLLSLMEILYTFDLGDEIGRGNLQKLLATLLKTYTLDEKIISLVVRCAENLITEQNARLQFFLEIVQEICDVNAQQKDPIHNRALINELLANCNDANLNFKLSSLKVKILDLEEQETNFINRKDYVQAHKVTEQKNAVNEEYEKLLQPLLEKSTLSQPLQLVKVVKNDIILKGLQITFHMIVSPRVNSLNPNVCRLYKDFICRHMASSQIGIRDWALQCATAFSMLYEALAKDTFDELYSQFYKNHNIRIWETSITCIFELMDRYGVDSFTVQQEAADQGAKSTTAAKRTTGRQLYNTLEFLDGEDDMRSNTFDQGVGVIYMMSHFLDTCDDVCILSAIVKGFCRLVLRGRVTSSEIMEKLLVRYFNPSTVPEINQVLGIFLEHLIQRQKYTLLESSLLPTVNGILSASYDSPLLEIRPETVTRFVISATRQEVAVTSASAHVHNKIAMSFLHEMLSNVSNKELCRLLAKELITLDLNVTLSGFPLKAEMKEMSEKLIKSDFDAKTLRSLINFKDMLDGVYNPPARPTGAGNESDEEPKTDDEMETHNSEVGEETRAAAANSTPPPTGSASVTDETASEAAAPTAAGETAAATPPPTPAAATNKSICLPEEYLNIPPPVNALTSSPMARTPTTFGPNNVVGNRFLRKSLNASRSQSHDSERSATPSGCTVVAATAATVGSSAAADGPTRTSKIRIEARIDSDKKIPTAPATTPPNQAETAEEQRVGTRARRNLRYGKEATAATTVPSPAKARPASARNRGKPQSDAAATTSDATLTGESEAELPATEQAANKTPRALLVATRSGRLIRPPRSANKSMQPESPAAPARRPNETLPSPDIIPPSPEPAQPNGTTLTSTRIISRRMRNMPAAAPATTAAASKEAALPAVTPPSPTVASGSTKTRNLRTRAGEKGRTSSGSTAANSPTVKMKPADPVTPVRNGRKRVLQPSPREAPSAAEPAGPTTVSNKGASTPPGRLSPKHKQQRLDVDVAATTARSRIPTRRRSGGGGTTTTSSTSDSSDGGVAPPPNARIAKPSGTSPNANTRPTKAAAAAANHNTAGKSPPSATRGRRPAQPTSQTSSSLKRSRPVTPPQPTAAETSSRRATTRQEAKLEYQSRMIMTRKRMSLESLSSSVSSSSAVTSKSPQAARPRATTSTTTTTATSSSNTSPMQPPSRSRIPVRSRSASSSRWHLKNAASTTATTTTASSSSDDNAKYPPTRPQANAAPTKAQNRPQLGQSNAKALRGNRPAATIGGSVANKAIKAPALASSKAPAVAPTKAAKVNVPPARSTMLSRLRKH